VTKERLEKLYGDAEALSGKLAARVVKKGEQKAMTAARHEATVEMPRAMRASGPRRPPRRLFPQLARGMTKSRTVTRPVAWCTASINS
jgi:hypothetical protein